MQEQRYLGRLEPDMDVCDVDGNKFGTITRVFRHELAGVATGTTTTGTPMAGTPTTGTPTTGTPTTGTTTMPREDIIEAKTGLLGLGKHYYIPFSAIQDVTSGCVFVNVPKDRVDDQGWEIRPDYLEEMS